MKINLYKLLFAFIVSVIFCGCDDDYADYANETPSLKRHVLSMNTSSSSLTCGYLGGSGTFTVHSENTPWRFDESLSWLSFDRISGGGSMSSDTDVTLTVDENTLTDSRTGVFFLKSTDKTFPFSNTYDITQSGAEPYLNIYGSNGDVMDSDNLSWTASATGGWGTFNMKTNTEVRVESVDSWYSIEFADDYSSITITVNENVSTKERSDVFYIYFGSSTYSYYKAQIYQYGATVTTQTESLTFDENAGSAQLEITSDASWTAYTYTSWINVTPESGSQGTSQLTVSVTANSGSGDRTGYVYVSIGGTSCLSIKVVQHGIYVETDVTSVTFASTKDKKTINVKSNGEWTIDGIPSWISITDVNNQSVKSGYGNATLSVTATDNPNTYSRSGTLKFSLKDMSYSASVILTQEAKQFSTETDVVYFEDKASTNAVDITSDASWSAYSNEDWITVSPTSATGNGQLKISVTENISTVERTGSVYVKVGSKEYVITVHQKAKYFTLTSEAFEHSCSGGTSNIEISTNDTWTATVNDNASWVKLSSTSGTGSINVSITTEKNNTAETRTATVDFISGAMQTIRVTITQKGRNLTVNRTSVMFFDKGGESEPIMISADGEYTCETECVGNWFKLSTVSANEIIVKAEKNTGSDPREGKIVVKLTGLVSGEKIVPIRVFQGAKGISKDEYSDDENWDIYKSDGVSIKVTGYSTDANWNSDSKSPNTSMGKDDFTSDTNWNI